MSMSSNTERKNNNILEGIFSELCWNVDTTRPFNTACCLLFVTFCFFFVLLFFSSFSTYLLLSISCSSLLDRNERKQWKARRDLRGAREKDSTNARAIQISQNRRKLQRGKKSPTSSANRFSKPLPSELSNLIKLQRLIDFFDLLSPCRWIATWSKNAVKTSRPSRAHSTHRSFDFRLHRLSNSTNK